MPTNFQINGSDFSDVYIPKAPFSEGGLWMWGRGYQGELGNNILTTVSSPVQTITFGTNWKLINCGRGHNGGIKTDGTLWMWGHNYDGRLGTGDTPNRSSPIQTITYGTNWKQVACGGQHTGAIKADGTLWMWGSNDLASLGTGDTNRRSSPIQTIAYGTNWKQIALGDFHTAAVKTDGTLWTWGFNNYGQLGTNDIIHRSSPIQTIAYGTNWKQVASRGYQTAAIKTDGTLWVWGHNVYGQLGTNDRTNRSSPIQTVTYGTNWKQMECGYEHTVAIKTDGTLWLWGRNSYGQLGTNDRTHRSSPIQTVAYGTNWKQVAGGGDHTAAVKADGTLWTWGVNAYNDGYGNWFGVGQLGTNDTTHRSSPIQTIAYGTNWKQVSGGSRHTGAVKSDGLV